MRSLRAPRPTPWRIKRRKANNDSVLSGTIDTMFASTNSIVPDTTGSGLTEESEKTRATYTSSLRSTPGGGAIFWFALPIALLDM